MNPNDTRGVGIEQIPPPPVRSWKRRKAESAKEYRERRAAVSGKASRQTSGPLAGFAAELHPFYQARAEGDGKSVAERRLDWEEGRSERERVREAEDRMWSGLLRVLPKGAEKPNGARAPVAVPSEPVASATASPAPIEKSAPEPADEASLALARISDPTVRQAAIVTARMFGVPVIEIVGPDSVRRASMAKFVLMHILRHGHDYRLGVIARVMNYASSAVCHALQRVREKMEADPEFADKVRLIAGTLGVRLREHLESERAPTHPGAPAPQAPEPEPEPEPAPRPRKPKEVSKDERAWIAGVVNVGLALARAEEAAIFVREIDARAHQQVEMRLGRIRSAFRRKDHRALALGERLAGDMGALTFRQGVSLLCRALESLMQIAQHQHDEAKGERAEELGWERFTRVQGCFRPLEDMRVVAVKLGA